ncbi:MAG TPA: hypothetical protein VMX77_02540 [Candidatus Bathyarchaeia archaeon]|nr:hypothetical protein [Candidatus Bathyarchaeia archaeon]
MKTRILRFQSKKLIWLVLTLVLFLFFTQLVISHRLVSSGEVVKKLEIDAARLDAENGLLKEEVDRMGSLSRISSEAAKLGLTRASQILHLTPQVPVALGK